MRIIVFLMIFISVSTHADSDLNSSSNSLRLQPPLVAVHQGGYPWIPGNNTIEKFKLAIKDKIDILEMDIRLTKDNVVVVFHDESLNSSTKCKGHIKDKTYDEISRCPYKNSKLKIPKYEDVLIEVNGQAIVNAEFKVQEVVVPAIKLIQKYGAYDWTYFQTKAERDRYILARSTDPRVALLYKANNVTELDWALSQNDSNLVVIEMEKKMATPENIKKVAQAKKLVSVNSWRYGKLEEVSNAACDKVFKLGIGIAVTNNNRKCKDQRKFYVAP